MTEFKKGDRVRVTLEGEVGDILANGSLALRYDSEYVFVHPPEKVEKIKPPVEQFEPGHFVRHKITGAHFYLAPNGYVRLVSDRFTNAAPFYEYCGAENFTSKHYEKVQLTEVPF